MNTTTPAPVPPGVPCYAEWLTIEQVARQCGGTPTQVRGWILTGVKSEAGRIRLSARKVGGNWRVNPVDIPPFVDAVTLASLPKSAATVTTPRADAAPAIPETEAARKRRVADCMTRLKAKGLNVSG